MNLGSIFRYLGIGGNAFAEALDGSIDRANVRFILPQDSALYLTQRTRRSINEKAEWLWQNFGIVKEGVAGIARHTVGKGISLQIDSEDDEWNQLGEDDFESYALTPERCDLAGRRNFYEAQNTGIEQRVLRGEFLCGKANNPEWPSQINGETVGEPCFQIYDSEEISTPGLTGLTAGKVIVDGVELNANSRAVNYHVRNQDLTTWTPVARSQMIHWFKAHAVNQVRGISDLAQAVNPLVDIHELKRLTTRSAKAQQLIALVLKGVARKKGRGALGGLKAASSVSSDTDPATDVAQLEQLVGAAGAGIAYLDGDGSAQLITPNSPTPLVEGFITDLLMRDVCAGWGVPAEFFWSIAKLGGANTRFVLSKADLLFQVLADGLISRFCTPIAYRYLQHRIAIGALRPCTDPNWALKLSWQTPPRVTVDNGNENKMLIEMLANGMITLREFCNARGLNYRHVMRQWVREPIEFLKIAKQELTDSKLPPEQQDQVLMRWVANMPLWRAAKPGAVSPSETDTTPPAKTAEEEAAAA